MARDPRGPRGGVREGAQDLDGGGLARAVRTEEAEGLPGRYLEANAADGRHLAVVLDQVRDGDDRFTHSVSRGASVSWSSCASSAPACGALAAASSASSARMRYIDLRVSVSTRRASAIWLGEPARRTSMTASMTCRRMSPSSSAISSVIP